MGLISPFVLSDFEQFDAFLLHSDLVDGTGR
jgi:hypothetical protein